MTEYIDENLWRQRFAEPDWPLHIYDEFRQLEERAMQSGKAVGGAIKEEIYSLIEHSLREGEIALGATGIDWDEAREPIETAVIHHTEEPTGMTLDRLNAMHLIRLYAAWYASDNPGLDKPNAYGQPIWSNHLQAGRQVFWGYHWLVRLDGQAERLLPDASIAWHAGVWAVNQKSIAICIDDDLSHGQPSETVIRACADLMKSHYPDIAKEAVVGHCQVREDRTCPGALFLPSWRAKLLSYI